jgi:hypothetical protein
VSDCVLADTGPLYALADPSGQYHLRACRESDRIQVAGPHPLTPYPVLCESYALVLRRLGEENRTPPLLPNQPRACFFARAM